MHTKARDATLPTKSRGPLVLREVSQVREALGRLVMGIFQALGISTELEKRLSLITGAEGEGRPLGAELSFSSVSQAIQLCPTQLCPVPSLSATLCVPCRRHGCLPCSAPV